MDFKKYSNLRKNQNDEELLGSCLLSQSWIPLKYLSYFKAQLNSLLVSLPCLYFTILPRMSPLPLLFPHLQSHLYFEVWLRCRFPLEVFSNSLFPGLPQHFEHTSAGPWAFPSSTVTTANSNPERNFRCVGI